MLFDLLEEAVSQIAAIDADAAAPHFWHQVAAARPDVVDTIKIGVPDPGAAGSTGHAIAHGKLTSMISDVPHMAKVLTAAVNNEELAASVRCAIVGVLAYVVQPHDLIPDDMPGGYGFIDDDMLLRASLVEFLDVLPPSGFDATRERNYIALVSAFVSTDLIPLLENALAGIVEADHRLRIVPADVLEHMMDLIIKDPLSTPLPDAPDNFARPEGLHLPSAPWTGEPGGGSVVVTGNEVTVSFPGGGGVRLSDGEIVGWI